MTTKTASDIASSMGRRVRSSDTATAAAPARPAAPAGPVSRLSVDLPKDRMKQLKMLSVERDTTIRELVIEMVDEYLAARS